MAKVEGYGLGEIRAPFTQAHQPLNFSQHYLTKTYLSMQMFKISQTRHSTFTTTTLSDPVQNLCNDRLSQCMNRASNFPKNPQQSSGCADSATMQLAWNQKKTNSRLKRVINTKDTNQMSKWRGKKIRELLTSMADASIIRQSRHPSQKPHRVFPIGDNALNMGKSAAVCYTCERATADNVWTWFSRHWSEFISENSLGLLSIS